MRRPGLLLSGAALLLASCTATPGADDDAPQGPAAMDERVEEELRAVVDDPGNPERIDLETVAAAGDAPAAWPLVDLLRFHGGDEPIADELESALTELTGHEPEDGEVGWVAYTDALLAMDAPAPDGYLEMKRSIHLWEDEGWAPFFEPGADLDWREVAWGGVGRDGIPALVDPHAIAADEADFLDADDVVFGIVLDGEARAYPRRFLEVHEMANDTLGDRRIALSYCTLCGAPIPYLVDDLEGVDDLDTVGEPLELRTSGLLQRSNKLMYDVRTESLFDQLDGSAVSGPLHRAGVELERVPVTVTSWEDWRRERPGTTVLDVPGDRGPTREIANYDGGLRERRDADGPIFPVGSRDERTDEQTVVLGVETPRGVTVAFPVERATAVLEDGGEVTEAGVRIELQDGGLAAHPVDGGPRLPAHEAFWFAWSQTRPDTLLWEPS